MAHCSSSSCEIAFAKAAVCEGLFRPTSRPSSFRPLPPIALAPPNAGLTTQGGAVATFVAEQSQRDAARILLRNKKW
jgi:hypothetical protein